ncbi:(S)-ureidoglycine--glyoxylate transaminase [BD1-7 clade bacterium]|uniref:(S)-ureidoglycine--glyoxylate transaminase n=1 Tax=BD1-7 clade bacterium TaxID=2029982 RepID=A0A5S9QN53_9GAMM|nr:(S)-ureidoglycine--glyoxylate transaminase [BD1-7 clade bacterium]CAA0121068.1 (S)-ureidoglycine--glyoxylate transaminase [BD1-7 clade bacterium]
MTRSFYPPQRTLMGPGPSDVSPRVLEALARPTIGHLDPLFIELMDSIKTLLQYVFKTQNALTLPISAPGSAGMEACFVNLVEPGDTVVICQNGVFGGRMRENVVRAGGIAIMVEDEWGRAVSPEKLEEALRNNPETSIVAFVHAETSTGAQSDAKTLCQIAKQFDCLTIVDTVTSLGGSMLEIDNWQIDAAYSGTQKCLSCVPGISPITLSTAAIDKIKNRKTQVQSWFLDLELIMGYWIGGGKRAYHHTAPVNAMYALHESLVLVKEEGLENAWNRHYQNHLTLKAGLDAIGLDLIVPENERLAQLNAVKIPAGVDDLAVRQQLLADYGLEIGSGLGSLAGKVWRIGLMGHASRKENILLCLAALESTLKHQGAAIGSGGVEAAMAHLRAR